MAIAEVSLRFLEGENEGVEIRLTPPRQLVLGRSEECDIFLGEKKISRQHFRIHVEPQTVVLNDLQSTNGTYVNGKKISSVELKDQDKVRVGNSTIEVTVLGGDGASLEKREAEIRDEEPDTRIVAEGPDLLDSQPGSAPMPIAADPMDSEDSSPSGVSKIPDDLLAKPTDGLDPAASIPEMKPPEEEGGVFLELEDEVPEVQAEPEVAEKGGEDLVPSPELMDFGAGQAFERESEKRLSGNLSAMGLADLLQNLAQNRKSGLLKLASSREGTVTIVEGNVLSAEVGDARGEKALYRMLGWNDGEFELLPLPDDFDKKKIKKPIKDSVETLLMEGFRQFDELEKIRKGLPEPTATLKLKPKFKAPLSKLHPRVLDILQVVINEGELEKVLDQSSFSDLETSKIVYYLLKKGYITSE